MKYFTYQEFEASATARRYGIDNRLPEAAYHLVTFLVERLLDPIREAFGAPILVSSGYRCPELNQQVKGVPFSHHVMGCAADLITGSIDGNRRLFHLILQLQEKQQVRFTQLIWEQGGRWIHLSYVPGMLKDQVIDGPQE